MYFNCKQQVPEYNLVSASCRSSTVELTGEGGQYFVLHFKQLCCLVERVTQKLAHQSVCSSITVQSTSHRLKVDTYKSRVPKLSKQKAILLSFRL